MGLFSFLNRRDKAAPTTPANWGPEQKSLVGMGRSHRPTYFNSGGSMLAILNTCLPDYRVDVSPRLVLDEIRAINQSFTPFTMAATKHAALMGRPMIKADDPKLQQELQDMADSFQVVSNNRKDGGYEYGLDVFCSRLREWSLLDGAAFGEIQEDDRGELSRLRIYDSTRFDVQTIIQFHDVLTFIQDNGAMVYVPETMRLLEFAPERMAGKPWGVPMAYNSAFLIDRLARLIINQGHQRDRISRPPFFAYLNIDLEKLKYAQGPERVQLVERLKTIETELKSMFGDSFSPNRSVNDQFATVGTLPTGSGVSEMTFGSNIPIMGEFEPEFNNLANLAFLPTEIPYPFIGLQGPSSGIGSDVFEKQMRLLAAKAKSNRHKVEPFAKKAMDMRMDSVKMNPRLKDQYTFDWDYPDLSDALKEAQEIKTVQEALAIGIDNYLNIGTLPGLTPQAAKRAQEDFAREHGPAFLSPE
jgi:hypothetical protein